MKTRRTNVLPFRTSNINYIGNALTTKRWHNLNLNAVGRANSRADCKSEEKTIAWDKVAAWISVVLIEGKSESAKMYCF
jgi:hypothetical protein